jgi:uncharacterized protein (TIGR02145 family)
MRKLKTIITLVGTYLLLISCGNTGSNSSIKIGTQTWATKNLDVSTFRNGDPIPEAKTNEEWTKSGLEQKPAWCYYNNDPANGGKCGKLYNWYAVNDPRGLAPKGWHIPTDAEWTLLTDNLGEDAGSQMKSTNGWAANENGSNKSGFTALPCGYRGYSDDSFSEIGNYGSWWSSTENLEGGANGLCLGGDSYVNRGRNVKLSGFSVRCIKN